MSKVVKIGAIVFGILLLVFSIIGFCFLIKNIKFYNKTLPTKIELIDNITNIDRLDIELKYSELVIVKGDKYKIENNNPNIKYYNNNGNIKIKEEHRYKDNSRLIINIPNNINKIEIEAGSGNITIKDIIINELDLELGAGKVEISNIEILDELDIDGGAGVINIINSSINKLDLELGVGEFNSKGNILKNSEIDAGIGNINIELDDINKYKFDIKKGIGNIKISDIEINNNQMYGIGNNLIKIEGAIGDITIK